MEKEEYIFENIQDYVQMNPQMTISQTVAFFNRRQMKFTKTMIQNYVRIGLLPPPTERRYYGHNHIRMLYIIDCLKTAFSLEEIKKLFSEATTQFNDFEQWKIEISEIYSFFCAQLQDAAKNQESIIEKNDFFNILSMMCQTVYQKKMALRQLTKLL